MTAGWPDPERPGVPLNPERDGAHCMEWASGEQFHVQWVASWRGYNGFSRDGWKNWKYVGPALTYREVAAREAAAVIAEREACAGWHDQRAEKAEADQRLREAAGFTVTAHAALTDMHRHRHYAAAIRARPAPAGGDALAAAVAAARREGIEAAAKWHDDEAADYFRMSDDVPDGTLAHSRLRARGQHHTAHAAAIRALARQPDPDLARDFTAWTEGQSDG